MPAIADQMQLNASFLSATEQQFTSTFATMAQRPRGVAFEEEEVEEEDDRPYLLKTSSFSPLPLLIRCYELLQCSRFPSTQKLLHLMWMRSSMIITGKLVGTPLP